MKLKHLIFQLRLQLRCSENIRDFYLPVHTNTLELLSSSAVVVVLPPPSLGASVLCSVGFSLIFPIVFISIMSFFS